MSGERVEIRAMKNDRSSALLSTLSYFPDHRQTHHKSPLQLGNTPKEGPSVKIVTYPHPSLRYPAVPVRSIDAEVKKIVEGMKELMYAHEGVGLAAPQVGVPIQLFIMNIEGDREQPDLERVLLNPVLSEKEGMEEKEEGCLSFPDLFQKVRRPYKIRVRAFDIHGNEVDEVLEAKPARIVQHETDHLHGKLFIDYFSIISKMAARSELAKFERKYLRQIENGELPPEKELLKELKALEESFTTPASKSS